MKQTTILFWAVLFTILLSSLSSFSLALSQCGSVSCNSNDDCNPGYSCCRVFTKCRGSSGGVYFGFVNVCSADTCGGGGTEYEYGSSSISVDNCKTEETNCSDGVDNDCDRKTDCADSDCACSSCSQNSDCSLPAVNPSGTSCYYGATCIDGSCSYSEDTNWSCDASRCNNATGWDNSACATGSGYCGDGLVQFGEQCDGNNLTGETCKSLGFDGGSLSCASNCTFNTSGCFYNGSNACTSNADCSSDETCCSSYCVKVACTYDDECLPDYYRCVTHMNPCDNYCTNKCSTNQCGSEPNCCTPDYADCTPWTCNGAESEARTCNDTNECYSIPFSGCSQSRVESKTVHEAQARNCADEDCDGKIDEHDDWQNGTFCCNPSNTFEWDGFVCGESYTAMLHDVPSPGTTCEDDNLTTCPDGTCELLSQYCNPKSYETTPSLTNTCKYNDNFKRLQTKKPGSVCGMDCQLNELCIPKTDCSSYEFKFVCNLNSNCSWDDSAEECQQVCYNLPQFKCNSYDVCSWDSSSNSCKPKCATYSVEYLCERDNNCVWNQFLNCSRPDAGRCTASGVCADPLNLSDGQCAFGEECGSPDCAAAGFNVTCASPTFCGDGTVQTPNDNGENEECDDGNTSDGDGCNSTCQYENCLDFFTGPSNGACANIRSDGYDLSWTPPTTPSWGAVKQVLRVDENESEVRHGCPTPGKCEVKEDLLGWTNSSYQVIGALQPDTLYYIRVAAVCQDLNGTMRWRDTVWNCRTTFDYANLSGFVWNASHDPIDGVSVTIVSPPTGFMDVTDENGYYHFIGVPAGSRWVSASKPGYRSKSVLFFVNASRGENSLNFTLTDGDCSACADWENRCSVACSGVEQCGVPEVPSVCEGARPGEVLWDADKNLYVTCCEGLETRPKLGVPTLGGCMDEVRKSSILRRYLGQLVSIDVYTWRPCSTS